MGNGFQSSRTPRLGEYSTTALVALLDHPNGWHRDTASRLLYQRQDEYAIPALKKLAATASLPVGRMTALYSLAGLDALDEAILLTAIRDADPRVRIHALRLGERFAGKSPAIAAETSLLADDSELRVRYQAAFSLGAFRGTALGRSRVACCGVSQLARTGGFLAGGRGEHVGCRTPRDRAR